MVYVYNAANDVWHERGSNDYVPHNPLPPVADFVFSAQNLSASFDGSHSSDADGTIIDWAFDFGDGTTAVGMNVQHTYTKAGSYLVTLRVKDNTGLFGTTSKQITVTAPVVNAKPIAKFVYTQGTLADSLRLDVDGSTSSDPDGTLAKYHWDFGNGSTFDTVNPIANGFYYTQAGKYTVTLTVTDNAGATASTSQIVTAQAPPSTAPTAQLAVTATGLTAKADSSGSTTAGVMSRSIQWGDGQTTTPAASVENHTYAASGTYTILLTISDTTSGQTATTSRTITVSSSAVTANLGPGRAAVPVWKGASGGDLLTTAQQSKVRQYTDPLYGYKSGDTFIQTLQRLVSNYGTGTIVEIPNGLDITEQNIDIGSDGKGYGVKASGIGLAGIFMDGPPTDARVFWPSTVLSATEKGYANAQGTYENNGVMSLGSSSNPIYLGGFTLEMAAISGLNMFNGLYLEVLISGSRMHAMRCIGLGYGNDHVPPGETGILRDHVPVGFKMTKTEFDGRSRISPDTRGVSSSQFKDVTNVDWDTFGARHTGMYLVNGANGVDISDCDFHDAHTSSLSFSFTSYPSTGSQNGFTHDCTTHNVRISYDANESTDSLTQFTGINHEENHGTMEHFNPTVVLNPAGVRGSYSHFNWVGADPLQTGVPSGQLIVHGGTFKGGPSGLPDGMPVVRTYSWGPISSKGYSAHMYTENEPIFYNNQGVRMKKYLSVSAAVAAGATKDTGFVWIGGK